MRSPDASDAAHVLQTGTVYLLHVTMPAAEREDLGLNSLEIEDT